MKDFKAALGARIKEARKRLGIRQKALADRTGLKHAQVISEIERGKREVKAWELAAIAKAVHVGLTDLLPQAGPPPQLTVLWREAGTPDLREKEAEFLKRCRDYHLLETLCELGVAEELPEERVDFDEFGYGDARGLAQRLCRQLDLGSQPAAALVPALEERLRVKIWYMPLTGAGSAASVRGDFGCAILMNSQEAPWRQNFNFAHELFHLVTWGSLDATEVERRGELWHKVESLANAFASELLLPTDAVSGKFDSRVQNNRITYLSLVEIAREFDVSTEALLYRLVGLRQLDRQRAKAVLADPRFRDLDRETMHEHWRGREAPTFPQRFVRLAFGAYQRGRLSRARLAELLEASFLDLEEVLLEYGLDEEDAYDTEVPLA